MADLPLIPDGAFHNVLRQHIDFVYVASNTLAEGDEPEAAAGAREAADNFFRSLGLAHEGDPRAYSLARTLMENVRGLEAESLPDVEVHAAVFGLTLGLMLARATGWEPPIDDRAPT